MTIDARKRALARLGGMVTALLLAALLMPRAEHSDPAPEPAPNTGWSGRTWVG